MWENQKGAIVWKQQRKKKWGGNKKWRGKNINNKRMKNRNNREQVRLNGSKEKEQWERRQYQITMISPWISPVITVFISPSSPQSHLVTQSHFVVLWLLTTKIPDTKYLRRFYVQIWVNSHHATSWRNKSPNTFPSHPESSRNVKTTIQKITVSKT